MRIQRLWAILACFLCFLNLAQAQSRPPVRILPLGDSITFGALVAGGYRLPLYQLLTNAGFNVDYVGTQTNNPATGLPDPDHEGHSGYRIDQIDDGFWGWANSVLDPDIILLLIGTNDYGQNYDTAHATNRLDHLIGNIMSNRPNARLVVANVLLRTDNPAVDAAIQTNFNPFVPIIVANHAAQGQQVYFIDMRSLLTAADLGDQLHPNAGGYSKMAAGWFGMITNLITPLGTTNAPVISRVVGGTNRSSVQVTFSKPITPADATNLANFSLSGGLTISGVSLEPVGQRIVTLTTSAQTPGQNYTVTVSNIHDVTPSHLVIAPSTAASFHGARLRGAFNNVPEAVNYTMVYSLDISNSASYDVSGVPYQVDYHYAISSFSRIGYYLEVQPLNGPLEFVWASFNAFTNDVSKIGVPALGGGGYYQGHVTNMNVLSSMAGVVNGTGLTGGYLEFWPNTYTNINAANVPGASSSTYDWGDEPTPGEYGSMQVFNLATPQTLFGFNCWATSVNGPTELGIGSSTGWDPDWTFSQDAPSYSVKTLQVFVLPSTNSSPPAISQSIGGVGRTNVLVRFSKPISDASANPANFVLNNGVTVSAAVLQPNLRDVLLTTSLQTAGTLYTLSVSGVADRANAANVIAPGSGTSFTALADPPVFSRVAESSSYRLVYTLALPTTNPNWYANAIHYTVDQSAFINQSFDRVAYYLELATNAGGTTNWVYVSANAFTPLTSQLGVPTVASGATFQEYLTNLNVYSSVAGVVTGTGLNGNIEFWPGNYSPNNADNIPNASSATYDFGDLNGGASPSAAYGSMQIHNYAASQTLFAINHWGDVSGGNLDVGIGNWSGANPDWTTANNAGTYAVKNLYVLAHLVNTAPATVAPVIVTQPVSRTNQVGSSATLFVNALGSAPAYQWRFNGAPLAGQTGNSLSLPFVNSWDAGNYDLVVSNSQGSATSLVARVTVIVPPPSPSSMQGTATLSGGAPLLSFTGTPGLTYQVQRANELPTTNWVTILSTNLPSPATSFQYLDPLPPADGAFYRLQWLPSP